MLVVVAMVELKVSGQLSLLIVGVQLDDQRRLVPLFLPLRFPLLRLPPRFGFRGLLLRPLLLGALLLLTPANMVSNDSGADRYNLAGAMFLA